MLFTHTCKAILGKTCPWEKVIFKKTSTNQKLNVQISTEAELVGASDAITHIFWTQYLLEAQSYNIADSVLFQENWNIILLEKL